MFLFLPKLASKVLTNGFSVLLALKLLFSLFTIQPLLLLSCNDHSSFSCFFFLLLPFSPSILFHKAFPFKEDTEAELQYFKWRQSLCLSVNGLYLSALPLDTLFPMLQDDYLLDAPISVGDGFSFSGGWYLATLFHFLFWIIYLLDKVLFCNSEILLESSNRKIFRWT